MIHRLPSAYLSLLISLAGAVGSGISYSKPNVVVIISDDGGYADWGFMDDYLQTLNPGQAPSPVPTPNLDTLRDRGVLFTNAYTASTCSPSRAAIVTGSYQQRIGYEYNINNLPEADAIDGLSPDTVTIFDRMKAEGYTTGAIGKWHIGARANDFGLGNRPENQGVDEFFGIWKGSRSYTIGSQTDVGELRRTIADPFSDTVLETTAPWNTTTNYVTNAFGQGAIDFIDAHYADADPFFLYVAFTAPHGPIGPSPDFSDPRIASLTGKRKEYASMVLTMDKEIGNILAKIDDPVGDGSISLTDNTLIVFINDNGGASGNGTVNTPLNDWKGSTYEGGNRVPILMAGPGIPGNPGAPLSYHKSVHSMDILPTCISVAGGSAIAGIDGVNLVPYLDGTIMGDPHEVITIRNSEKVAVRKGDWKLTKSPNKVPYALFNIASDIGETTDLSGSNPDKVAELQRDFTAFEAGSDKPRFVGLDDPADSVNYNDHFRLAPQASGGSSSFTRDGTILIGGITKNGDFNAGGGTGGQDYDATPNWVNLGSSGSTGTATNDNSSSDGTRNAIISESGSRLPGIDTGHDLSAGESFQVTYQWLDANNWNDATSRVSIRLFVTDDDLVDGSSITIQSMDSALSQTDGLYQTETHVFSTIPAAMAGKRLFLSISTAQGGPGFARVDNVVLERGTVSTSGGAPDLLDWSEANAWTDLDTGALDTLLEFDAFPGAVLEFPTTDGFSYTATNNMTRISDLEFMLNRIVLSGSFSGSSPQSGIIDGLDLLFTNSLSDSPPEINLAANGEGFSYLIGNDLILYDDLRITGDGTATFEIAGNIRDYYLEPHSVTKEGSSTVLLSGIHTYSGTTTVSGGSLLLASGSSLVNSEVIISSGATFGGNGSVGGPISGAGRVSPGQSIGTLATTGAASPGELVIEIDSVNHDLFEVAGELDLTGTSLTLVDLGGGFSEDSYIIASYGSRNGVFSGITGLPVGYIIDYNHDDGSGTKHIALVRESSLTSYQVWVTNSILAGADAAFEADPNQDGIANGLAFFLGAPDAHQNALGLLPTSDIDGAEFVYVFDRADAAASQDFTVQYSGDLDQWSAAPIGVGGVSISIVDHGATDEITVRLPQSLTENSSLFVRLTVRE